MPELLHQTGGVVFRYDPAKNKHKILMVTSKRDFNKWLFPKGDIDEGESDQHTARKEVLEEAGIAGEVLEYLGSVTYPEMMFMIDLRLFLIKFVEESNKPYEKRLRKWVDFDEAVHLHHLGHKIKPIVRRAKGIVKRKC
jgi:8-oxo-dGTP pyrophosphatase MutT (NUDIX family)